MKKLFSLLTLLLLLCTSAWAETFTMSSIFTGSNTSATVTSPVDATVSTTASASNADDGKLSGDDQYFQIVLTTRTFTAASFNGYINSNSTDKNWAFQFSTDGGTTWSAEATQANDGTKSAHDISVGVTIPSGANGIRIIRKAGTSSYVYSISLTLNVVTTYSVTYALNGGTGTTPTESAKAASAKFTLHNGTTGIIAPSGKVFSQWKDQDNNYFNGGATYTMPSKNVTLTAQWSDIYTVTYKSGEGTGADVEVSPATTVADCPNTFTAPDGKRFAGWKDGEGTDYAVGATVTSDLTLTAQWEIIPINYSFAPTKTSGSLSANEIVATSTGGVMQVVSGSTMDYTENGLMFKSSGNTKVNIILKNSMKVGTTITATVWSNTTTSARSLKLNNSSGTTKVTWSFTPASASGEEKVYTYTVVAEDGLDGSNQFQLQRGSDIYLRSLTVTNGGAEYAEPVMLKENTWASFCPSFDVTVPAEGSSNVSVNYATFNSSTNVLTTHKLNASGDVKIKAGEGVLLKASAAGLKQFLATTGAEEIDGNVLGGTTERTLTSTLKGSETYLMALNGENTFVSYTGEYFPANKAYFAVTPAGSAPSGIRIVDEESNATSLSDIESTDEGVKFIQNGQLFIKKNGVVYDMLGIVVRK